MPKRNSEIIMEKSLYDLLCTMNARLRTNTEPMPCIMTALGAGKARENRCRGFKAECDKCVSDWLNEFPF